MIHNYTGEDVSLYIEECAEIDKAAIAQELWKPYHKGLVNKYLIVTPRNKGVIGENIVASVFKELGHEVAFPNVSNGPYDLLIDGIQTEVKTSVAQIDYNLGLIIPYKWMINHLSLEKDWARFVLLGINPEGFLIRWISKETFREIIRTEKLFGKQQGGTKLSNDDYMLTGVPNILKLLPQMESISLW